MGKEEWKKILTDSAWEIFQKAQVILCVISREGECFFINPWGERVTGYSKDEIVGRNWWEVFYPGESYRQVEEFLESVEGKLEDVRNYEMVLTAKDGKGRNILWDSNVTFKGDKTEYIIGVGVDITETKKRDREVFLKEKEEALMILTGGLVHDLSNILTGLSMQLRAVSERIPEEEILVEKTSGALESAERAIELVRRLGVYCKSAGLPERDIKPGSYLEGVLRRYSEDFPEVEVDSSIDSEIVIRFDPARFQQLVENLVSNAFQYQKDGEGRVDVSLGLTTRTNENFSLVSFLKIEIRDSGQGIDQANLSKIFDPYFTEKPLSNREGAGLGLALVWSIVKEADGVIEVESQEEGGTTFRVLIPMKDKDD